MEDSTVIGPRSPKRQPSVYLVSPSDRRSLDDSVLVNPSTIPRAAAVANLITHHDDLEIDHRPALRCPFAGTHSTVPQPPPGDERLSSSSLEDMLENVGERSEGTRPVPNGLLNDVVEETLNACLLESDSLDGHEGSGDEDGFLIRMGRSLKSLFNNCVNRPPKGAVATPSKPAGRPRTPPSAHIHRGLETGRPAKAELAGSAVPFHPPPPSPSDVPMLPIHQAAGSPGETISALAASAITQAPAFYDIQSFRHHSQPLMLPPSSVIIDLPPMESTPILPELHPDDVGKKCLVLDLDETLVHSSFVPVPNADYVLPLSLSVPGSSDPLHGTGSPLPTYTQNIYVCKRPGVDIFLDKVTRLFEVVIFTASLSNYADPVINFLDPERRVRHRLYREDCVLMQGLYIKDLSRLGRALSGTVIVDNSPASYLLQPDNAVAIKSWFNDPDDSELHRLLPSLALLSSADSVAAWRQSAQAAACTGFRTAASGSEQSPLSAAVI